MKDLNIEMCIEEAITFLNIAEKLDNDEETIFGGIFPFVVNVALSCELFLKSIIYINSKTPEIIKKHELNELFKLLPKDDQTHIKNSFNKKLKHDFNNLLGEFSNAFVEWRYAYENSVKINITGILTFAHVLNDYIKERYLETEE